MHGGGSPRVKANAKLREDKRVAEITLSNAIAEFELDDVHPAEALLREVQLGAAMQTYLRQKVASLSEDEIAGMFTASERYDDDDGTTVVTKVIGGNVWLKLLGEWSDRTARISKMALDAGIAERHLQLVEDQARAFAATLWTILDELGVHQGPEVTSIVRRNLLALNVSDAV